MRMEDLWIACLSSPCNIWQRWLGMGDLDCWMGFTDGDLRLLFPSSSPPDCFDKSNFTSQNLGADLLTNQGSSRFVTLVLEHINTSSQARLELCLWSLSPVSFYLIWKYPRVAKSLVGACYHSFASLWIVLKWQISILYIPVIYPSRPCSVQALSSVHRRLCSVAALLNEDMLSNWWQILLSL